MRLEMGDAVGEEISNIKPKDPKDWNNYHFDNSSRAERDQAVLALVKSGNLHKLHTFMPEWQVEKKLSLGEIGKISAARNYLASGHGLNNTSYNQDGSELFEGEEITALTGERNRILSGLPAPVHRHNAFLSMVDRYETEMWVEAQIKAEQDAGSQETSAGIQELRPAA